MAPDTLPRPTVLPRPSERVIRPCMISFYFHPEYSGSAIQALNLCRHLQPLGVQPLIVSANLSGNPSYEMHGSVPLYRLPLLKAPELRIPTFAASLLQFLFAHRHEYDVIHAHGTLPHAAASIAGRWLSKPTVLKVAMAQSDIAFGRQGRLHGRINRALVSRFDRYIATTPDIVDEFTAQGLDASRVELIPNGVDTATFSPLAAEARSLTRRRLGLPDVPTVAYVGIINGRKNVDGILRIWRTVCTVLGEAHLLLIGPQPDAADPFLRQLNAYVETNGLRKHVTFTGRQDPIVPYLRASDAFLFPSRREGMANSVLEAMACGLPCLVSSAAGVAAVVDHGQNGYKLDVDDEQGFADILVSLITEPNRRDRIGAAARRTIVDTLSLATTAARYRNLYEELLSEGPVARG